MSAVETLNNPYYEIKTLISQEKFALAEEKLHAISDKIAQWHFLYSCILVNKAWFDSAKNHLETAISMDPDHSEYKKAHVALMGRYRRYGNTYYDGPRRHHRDCCCCCCDDCHVSCCDLICLDTCCECMGGDLIECI